MITEDTQTLRVGNPSFRGYLGIARRDITPPVGIYSRMWGCARHDVAEGIHRPLAATAVACRALSGGSPMVVIGLDLGWWRSAEDEWLIRGPVLDRLGLDPARLMIQTVHTHAGPSTSLEARDKPGGEKIDGYLAQVRQMVVEVAREALETAGPATLSWTVGRCNLAANRDLPYPGRDGVLCGYNPDQAADDTVLIGRITTDSQTTLATIVNYACHPTSLGGDNRLISPDYVGAMREVVEDATGGAPCLFLQGASGELGPRRGFEGDAAVADRNGRQLGHAVLSALEGMLPGGQALAFVGEQPSGAPLAIWRLEPDRVSTVCEVVQSTVELGLKNELADIAQLAQRLAECDDRVVRERLERAYQRRLSMGDTNKVSLPIWGWRWGDAIMIGTQGEAYSMLQTELRRQFPQRAIIVLNMINGHASYLAPAQLYGSGAYQVEVSLFGPGCLETTLDECVEVARRLDKCSPADGDTA